MHILFFPWEAMHPSYRYKACNQGYEKRFANIAYTNVGQLVKLYRTVKVKRN